MSSPKRYFHCSRSINLDAEVWCLTQTFGERAFRLWIEILAILDRENNAWKPKGGIEWVNGLSKTVRMNPGKVLQALSWMVNQEWLACHSTQKATAQELAENFTRIARELPEKWPRNDRRIVSRWISESQELLNKFTEITQETVFRAPNYMKYYRFQKNFASDSLPHRSPNVPDSLSVGGTPTPTPTPTPKNKEKELEEAVDTVNNNHELGFLEMSPTLREWARAKGINNLEVEWEAFTLHSQSRGVPILDLEAGFKSWLLVSLSYPPKVERPATEW